MDEHLKAALRLRESGALAPDWDSSRQARVLGGVLDSIEETESSADSARWWWGGVSAALVAAGVTFALLQNAPSVEDAPSVADTQTAPAEANAPSQPPETVPSELRFAKGTRALLDPGSEVTTLAQSVDSIVLQQESGRVLYEVNPKAEQRFQVGALGVMVEVIGTRFSVDIDEDSVVVNVEEGAVRVETAQRKVVLREGESVRLAAAEEGSSPQVQRPEQDEPKTARATGSMVDKLLSEADAARRSGDLAKAERALSVVAKSHASDPRSVSALFSLARVQRAQGRAAASAQTFAQVQRRSSGSMKEDALAEEAISLAQAGNSAAARARASNYLRTHPNGIHRTRMEKLSAAK